MQVGQRVRFKNDAEIIGGPGAIPFGKLATVLEVFSLVIKVEMDDGAHWHVSKWDVTLVSPLEELARA